MTHFKVKVWCIHVEVFFRRDSGAKSAIREKRKARKSIGSLCINVSMEKLASPQ